MSNSEPLKEDFSFIEKLVMKNCLENEQYLATVIQYLKPEQFADKSNQLIVKLLQTYFSKTGKKPSPTELNVFLSSDKLKDAYTAVKHNIQDVGDDVENDTLLTHTERFLKIQSFEKALLHVASNWDNVSDKDDIIKFYNQIEEIIGYNLKTSEGHDYFNDIETYIDSVTTDESVLPTGLDWLDEKLNGGFLQDGRALYLFAGETNVGKSIFLHNMAVNIMKQDKKVLLFSLEMSEQMYSNRITSTLSQLDINNLRRSVEDIRKGAEHFKQTKPNSGLIVKEYPPNTITAAVLRNYTKHVIATKKFKPDAIVLDYLNLLAADGNNSYERIKIVSEQVRALSYEFNCPVISATQLNRSGYSGAGSSSQTQVYDQRGPGMSSISESYGTGATADAVVGIFRTDQDKEDNAIHINIMKSRFGQNTGVNRMGIDYRTMTLFEDEALNENDDVGEAESSAGEFSE